MSGIDDTIREELGALLDGALDDARAAALRERLESNDLLRREYEELRRTVAAVRALPRESVDLRAAVRAKLVARPARVFPMRLVAIAAVLFVAVGLALYGFPKPEQKTLTEASRRQQEPAGVDPDVQPHAPAGSRARDNTVADRADKVRRATAELRESKESKSDEAAGSVAEAPRPVKADVLGGVSEKKREPRLEAEESEDVDEEQDVGHEQVAETQVADEKPVAGRRPVADEKPVAGKKKDPAKRLLAAVERGGPLVAATRRTYLDLLRRMKDDRLRKHLAVLGRGARPAQVNDSQAAWGRDRRGAPPLVRDLVLPGRIEADRVKEALDRAYRSQTLRPSVRMAGATREYYEVDIEVSRDELVEVLAFLELLEPVSVGGKVGMGGAAVRAGREKPKASHAEEKRKRFRVRIRFVKPKGK